MKNGHKKMWTTIVITLECDGDKTGKKGGFWTSQILFEAISQQTILTNQSTKSSV
jgi:hypothetical protein